VHVKRAVLSAAAGNPYPSSHKHTPDCASIVFELGWRPHPSRDEANAAALDLGAPVLQRGKGNVVRTMRCQLLGHTEQGMQVARVGYGDEQHLGSPSLLLLLHG
jgi:hypothetical protein